MEEHDFTPALGCLIKPATAGLAARLGHLSGLGGSEAEAIRHALTTTLYEAVHRRVSRVLIVELNAARVCGRLKAGSPRERWDEFLAIAGEPEFWAEQAVNYPALPERLRTVVDNRCEAAFQLAARFAEDRAALGLGELREVELGRGDSHRRGQTVAILTCEHGKTVYKPRSVAVDRALAHLITRLGVTGIRVPDVIERDGYGWAEFVRHRHCADDEELQDFYLGTGKWLALMRILGGVDLHAENLIACGPVPVIVDCETLFTPIPPGRASGLGEATDRAAELVEGTVLRTGLLPGRGVALGWRGVDASGMGSLPGQQPGWDQPVIVGGGTDRAHIGTERVEAAIALNHPSPEPELARYWPLVLKGFGDLTRQLRELDRRGELEPMLAGFAGSPVRVVPRATEVYAEVGRMLWHPVSLHDEAPATHRAARLLAKMSEALPLAPDDPVVIRAEIDDLREGDIPFFTTTAGTGRLAGPRGTTWMPERDLVADSLARWRQADLALEKQVIRAAMVSAYLNDGWSPGEAALSVTVDGSNLDGRRRALAAGIMRRVVRAAIRGGGDGTATWIAPVLNDTGWAVQPLNQDLYGGAAGVAILLAGYRIEAKNQRATPVDGVGVLLEATMATLRAIESRREVDRASGVMLRPDPPGGYIGLGSQIWSWLTLHELEAAPDGLERAAAIAGLMPDAVAADRSYDLLTGMAGAIPALLKLSAATGDDAYFDQAVLVGQRLSDAAQRDGRGAFWPTERWPHGLGGFAHGSTGIGWALSGLGFFDELARAALAFEEAAFDSNLGGWRDLRQPEGTATAWCHGAVGIGLSTRDQNIRERAAKATWSEGMGWNHTLCHGDLGAWELLRDFVDPVTLQGYLISSLEQHGPISGLARDAFSPGLLPGLGGVAYQLLRLHPDCALPSVLIP
ncbi:MAG TPA: type 2 lanthipeptide synthetase LanM family protein [Candidatus Limnocylindrales bacterium]